jgi:uncharacterized protein YjbJ (UPF0337 family)
MSKNVLRGKVEKLKGRAKEMAGGLTGNKEQQAEGRAERAHGALREKIGKVAAEAKRDLEGSGEEPGEGE